MSSRTTRTHPTTTFPPLRLEAHLTYPLNARPRLLAQESKRGKSPSPALKYPRPSHSSHTMCIQLTSYMSSDAHLPPHLDQTRQGIVSASISLCLRRHMQGLRLRRALGLSLHSHQEQSQPRYNGLGTAQAFRAHTSPPSPNFHPALVRSLALLICGATSTTSIARKRLRRLSMVDSLGARQRC